MTTRADRSSDRARLLLGVLSLVPVAYAIALGIAMASGDLPSWIWIPHATVMVLSLALIVYCVRDIWRRDAWPESERSAWALLVVFLGFVTIPVYLLVVRRRSTA
jgi:phospholipase D-like protein